MTNIFFNFVMCNVTSYQFVSCDAINLNFGRMAELIESLSDNPLNDYVSMKFCR